VLRAVQTVIDKVKEAGHTVTPWEPYKHDHAVDMIGKIYTADGGTVSPNFNNTMVHRALHEY
jgi:amidase